MCNLYSITTNQAAIAALFRVVYQYVGNLAPMPGVFPDYPAPVIRNTETGRELAMIWRHAAATPHRRELAMMWWGMPPPPRTGGPPVTNIRNLPKKESALPEWQAAIETLMLVVEHGGSTMFAGINVMRALNRNYVPEFNPKGKEPHWGKRKLKRDQP